MDSMARRQGTHRFDDASLGAWPRTWACCRPGLFLVALTLATAPGCASLRRFADRDLAPCRESFAETADGWRLGVRRYRPARPDPGKLPVVLCHGLGLNATFWTITDNHLPGQLAGNGYEVFVFDLRGSGGSHRIGHLGQVNRVLREAPVPELGNGDWTVDDLVRYDIPAILDHVRRLTGHERINWVGHSLGGMMMYPFLEIGDRPERIHTYVGMGAPALLAIAPQTPMLRANRALQTLTRGVSTSRMARPMQLLRPPGLGKVDRFYFNADNVDRRTISRFYGYTLEDLGRGALKQLEVYLATGHLVSADGSIDYALLLPRIETPTLLIAGEGDIMADVPSTLMTLNGLSSPDKTLWVYGRKHGHVDDYGHCDLVWSRHAPREIFPELIDWLDARQPGATISDHLQRRNFGNRELVGPLPPPAQPHSRE